MSSAVSRDWVGVVVLARLYRAVRDSGEFIVIVAAVWVGISLLCLFFHAVLCTHR
jgi:hypothetical protein